MALICKKMYSQKLEPQCFIAEGIDGRWYPQKRLSHFIYSRNNQCTCKRSLVIKVNTISN